MRREGTPRAHKDKLLSTSAHFPALLNTSFENYATVQIGSFKTSMAVLSIVDLASRDPLNSYFNCSSKIIIRRRMLNPDRDEIYISQMQLMVPASMFCVLVSFVNERRIARAS
uniref:Uncharacterized protein n=1 Tax=Ascaris lumbricoides TaxID=6252 RepID=A0A0M3IWR1_ASCLU